MLGIGCVRGGSTSVLTKDKCISEKDKRAGILWFENVVKLGFEWRSHMVVLSACNTAKGCVSTSGLNLFKFSQQHLSAMKGNLFAIPNSCVLTIWSPGVENRGCRGSTTSLSGGRSAMHGGVSMEFEGWAKLKADEKVLQRDEPRQWHSNCNMCCHVEYETRKRLACGGCKFCLWMGRLLGVGLAHSYITTQACSNVPGSLQNPSHTGIGEEMMGSMDTMASTRSFGQIII